jgi:hypothetical protein
VHGPGKFCENLVKKPTCANQATTAIKRMSCFPKSNLPTLADKDLTEAGKKVAQAIKIGDWQENKKPQFNESGDKALIESGFIASIALLIYPATFHNVGDVWKLRGVRETMQALLARPPEKQSNQMSE